VVGAQQRRRLVHHSGSISWASEIAIVHPEFARGKQTTLTRRHPREGGAKGKVVDAKGRPVANARVGAGPWTTTTTAEDGTFTLNNIPPD
jgi:hypothetical protein